MNRIKKFFIYQYLKEYFLKIVVSICPEHEVDRNYYNTFKRHCDLKHPKDLIEKIYWMELHSDTSLWTLCADKFRAREYIEKLGLLDYMPKLYGHWDRVRDIDFDSLPSKFVIKSNNGCGTVKVVSDKLKLDISKLKSELRRWIVLPNGYTNAQLHNTKMKRCILAEELLENDYKDISPNSLVDFKIYCINGKPLYIWIAYNRNPSYHLHHTGRNISMQMFDSNWNPCPEYLSDRIPCDVYDENDTPFPKPDCLSEMLDIASKIAAPFKQVRVDFYIVKKKPVIGEMTFSTGYGFLTDEFYLMLGDMIKLP